MMATKDLSPLLQNIQKHGEAATDEAGRQALLSSAQALVTALESPIEKVARIGWYEPTIYNVLRVVLDLGLFEAMLKENRSAKTATKLAEMTNSDPRLLGKITVLARVEESG
jgi:hypothetical protein